MNINLQSSLLLDRKDLTSTLASRNELLRQLLAIPTVENYLLPEFRTTTLSVNQVLYAQGDRIDFVYFPVDSIASGLVIMEDGTTLETSMAGRDSMIGVSTILGTGVSPQWIWVTVAGTALQLESRLLDKLVVQLR